ncbi:MAG: hypothetical protein IJW86_06350 [Clostridia bacterium]|nr:hypothetical protein [Clostridia bacterium]
MKKTISLIIAVVLAFSLFSVGTFAAGTKTEALFDTAEQTKEVAVTFRTGMLPEFGSAYSAVNTVYLKGDKIAYDFDNGFIELRTVLQDDGLYSYLTTFPFIHMQTSDLTLGNTDIWQTIKGLSDFTMDFLVFVKSYETTIDGTTYYVEEFSDRGSVINSFFYVGDDLKVLKAQDFMKGTIQYTYFDNISLSVDDSIFELPAVSFDLTGIMKIILSLFA